MENKHVAVFAFPFGTHFMALLNLVLKLAQTAPNCSFSFICTQKSNATHFNRPHIPKNIKAYSISDGIPMSHAQLANHPIEKVNLFLKTGPQNLQKGMPQDLLIVGERETMFSRTLVSLAKVLPQAKAVVMNLFEELDPPFSKSVAYVCFGTLVAPPPHELVTVAEALEESGFPFLWSLMEGLMDLLPNGFLERTKMRGKVVSWAPQSQVLAHGSSGVFVSNCGANSVTESVCGGVPMICRPFFGDEGVAGRLIEDVWEIGVVMEGKVFTENGLLKSLNLILAQEEGKKIRDNALKVKQTVQDGTRPEGQAARDLKTLIEIISTTS
ncbi:hypothetical protein JHK87_016385 [Glycine soja]|nr:hypothetical protein JHK87_016385 [Glycine soja]